VTGDLWTSVIESTGQPVAFDICERAITGILSSSDARRFLVFGVVSRRSAAHVQAVRSAAVLAKAHPFTPSGVSKRVGCHEARSPKRRTWRAGVLTASLRVPVMVSGLSA